MVDTRETARKRDERSAGRAALRLESARDGGAARCHPRVQRENPSRDAAAVPMGTTCDPGHRALRALALFQPARAAAGRALSWSVCAADDLDPLSLDPLEREMVRAHRSAGDRPLGGGPTQSNPPAAPSHPGSAPSTPPPPPDDPRPRPVATCISPPTLPGTA